MERRGPSGLRSRFFLFEVLDMPAIQVLQNQSATLEIAGISQSSSCTVSVFKPSGTAMVTDAAATLDTTNTTIQSQEGASPETLNVSSVSGFVAGRPYIIESTLGQTSVLILSQVQSSGNKLIAHHARHSKHTNTNQAQWW